METFQADLTVSRKQADLSLQEEKMMHSKCRSNAECVYHLPVYTFAISVLIFFSFVAIFLLDLHSTLSDYSAGDISYHLQLFYNFIHGRPLQSSLYLVTGKGIVANLYPYLNHFADHVNFTHYIFSYAYSLWPNIYMLYLSLVLFSYAGIGYFVWRIINYLSPERAKEKFLLAMSFFLTSNLLVVFQDKAYPILYSGPFFFAAYYYMITKSRIKYIAAIIALCLIAENAALFVITFSCYVYIFEPRFKRYAYFAFLFSLFWVALVVFVIQPAVRLGLVTEHSSFILSKIAGILRHGFIVSPSNIARQLVRWVLFLPVFVIVYVALYRRESRIDWQRYLGLIFIAPLSAWVIGIFDYFAYRIMPIVLCSLLSLVIMLADSDASLQSRKQVSPRRWVALIFLLIFVTSNVAYLSRIYIPTLVQYLNKSREAERLSNVAFISAMNNIPSDRSVVFWSNVNTEAFIANRSDVWFFPNYFDLADFLVIQKGARRSFFQAKILPGVTLREALKNGTAVSTEDAIVDAGIVQALTQDLVYTNKTHSILRNDDTLLILMRNTHYEFVVPPHSMGFGWITDNQ